MSKDKPAPQPCGCQGGVETVRIPGRLTLKGWVPGYNTTRTCVQCGGSGMRKR